MKNKNILLILALVCSAPLQVNYSQNFKEASSADTAAANKYFEEGRKLFMDANYDSSIIVFEKAQLIYEKENTWNKYVECLKNIGTNYYYSGRYDSASNYAKRSFSIGLEKLGERSLEVAQTYHLFGNIYLTIGNYEKALDYFQKSMSINFDITGKSSPGAYSNI
jgi:tetratricopeptide (TPR) repeat protein